MAFRDLVCVGNVSINVPASFQIHFFQFDFKQPVGPGNGFKIFVKIGIKIEIPEIKPSPLMLAVPQPLLMSSFLASLKSRFKHAGHTFGLRVTASSSSINAMLFKPERELKSGCFVIFLTLTSSGS